MPYKSKKKCVYKKNTGKKVGCTKGKVKDYLAALHANVVNENVENEIKNKYEGYLESFDLYENIYSIILNKIIINKEFRKDGYGSKVMNDLINYADKEEKVIVLTPSTDFGGTSVNRLIQFYKKFGFKMNKGINKDFKFKDLMIRQPLKQGQKRVNENELIGGEDKIYYHGGDSEITKFSYDVEKKNRIGNVAAFYFTDIKHVALGYGKVLTQVKLDIKNTFIFGVTEPNIEMARQYKKELISENPHIDKYSEWFDDKVQKMFQYKKLPYTGMDGMAEQRVYKAGGFDSVKDGHEIAVFDSDNIKIISSNMVNENINKLKGGKADNLTSKDIANKFKVSVKYIKDQIKKGKKVESEHTDDEEKQTEIVMDHISEFPDYYIRIKKMEKEAKKDWNEKLNETKILIKTLLRENLTSSVNPNIKDQLYKEMDRLGLNPDNVGKITINGKEVNLGTDEGFKKAAQRMALACTLTAGVLGCQKENLEIYSYNTNVHGIEYKIIDPVADENTTLTPEDIEQGYKIITVTANNDKTRTVKAKYLKDQQGNSSGGGWTFKEEPTEIEMAIHTFGQTKKEEARSNGSFLKGAKIVDYIISNPTKQKYNSSPLESIRDTEYFKTAIDYINQGPIEQKNFNDEMKQKKISITAEKAINKYGNK